jgi:hypothetical protein
MGGVDRNRWRSVAAQLAALALLLRAVLLPADCSSGLTGLPSAANEAVGASVLTLLDPVAYGLLCSHGTGAEEDAGPSPSGQPGKHGQHSSPACCGMCCVPALPAVLAELPALHAQSQTFAGAFAESVRLATNSLTRNRSPPAFLSA